MVKVELKYEGNLHCQAVHSPSGATIATDAPKDNQGRGESFSPTDLVATALGTCMLTIMGIMAKTLGISIDGTTATVEKEMAAAPVRRIARLAVRIHIPHKIDEANRIKLERAAHSCPVHQSLHPDVEKPVEFIWGE